MMRLHVSMGKVSNIRPIVPASPLCKMNSTLHKGLELHPHLTNETSSPSLIFISALHPPDAATKHEICGKEPFREMDSHENTGAERG